MERTKNAIRNIAWGYINRFLGLLLPFIFRTVMIYTLGAEYLGLNSLFTSILQVLNLSELGVGTAIVYSMYKPIAENDTGKINALLNLYKRIYRIIGIAILAIGLVLLPFIPNLISGTYPSEINIYFVYLIFLINTSLSYFLFAYRASLMSAFQRNDLQSKIATFMEILVYTSASLVIYLTKDYYNYLYIALITTVFQNIVNLLVSKKYFPKYKCEGEVDAESKKEIKKNVFALFCHKIGGTIINSSDSIVISAFLGLAILAKYTNYYFVMTAVESLILICFTAMTAGVGNSFILESVEKNREDFRRVLLFNSYIVVVFGTIMFCLFQNFIELWVGPQYLYEMPLVILIMIYFFIHSIRRTIIMYRDASGMWWDNKWQPIVAGVFNIVLNIVLVNIIGIYGIVISTILSMLIIDIPWETKAFCNKKIKLKDKEYYIKLITYFIVFVCSCGISQVICELVNVNLVVNLIIKFVIAFTISNFIFYLCFRKSGEYKYYVEYFKKIIRRKKNSEEK